MRTVLIHVGKHAAKTILRSIYEKQTSSVYQTDDTVVGSVITARFEGSYVHITSQVNNLDDYLPKPLSKYFYEEDN